MDEEVPAAQTVPKYYRAYEERFGLQVIRPVTVDRVEQPGGVGSDFMVTVSGAGVGATARTIRARAIVNATGTWDRPRIPYYPGIGTFAGRQLHTRDYTRPEDFAGERVLVVGAGISAVQHLAELAPVAQTSWVTRTRPDIRNAEFTPEVGADVVARVDERVRQGLPPASVVSNTGLPINAVETGALPQCHPMFDRLDAHGAVWDALSLRSWGSAPEARRIDVGRDPLGDGVPAPARSPGSAGPADGGRGPAGRRSRHHACCPEPRSAPAGLWPQRVDDRCESGRTVGGARAGGVSGRAGQVRAGALASRTLLRTWSVPASYLAHQLRTYLVPSPYQLRTNSVPTNFHQVAQERSCAV